MDLGAELEAAIIGVVEGVTEFLPISSTGHIIVTQRALGFRDPGDLFAVVIQLGAILAVCWYFRERLWRAVSRVGVDPAQRRFLGSVLLAFAPAAVGGFLLNDWLEEHVFGARGTAVIAIATLIGGALILLIESRQREPVHRDPQALPWRTALAIGMFQLLALIPGVSRSGASILGALLIGVERRAATEFSFFLAIPIMLGASTLKLVKHGAELHATATADAASRTSDVTYVTLAIGFVVSFAVALAVVHWLLRFVAGHSFKVFGWYRIVAGLALIAAIWLNWIPAGTPASSP